MAAGGPYQIYSKNFKVTVPADMEGKKWGVSGSTASKAMELLGGSPTTMSSGELYLALQRCNDRVLVLGAPGGHWNGAH